MTGPFAAERLLRVGLGPVHAPDPEPVDILLVDDQPRNLVALSAILDEPQYRCVQAGSGAEALRLVLERRFAVILLDVVMPEMDGLEVATLIKSRPRSRDIPIIFLTALGDDLERVHQAYSLGAVDYLVKPVRAEVVRAKVRVFVELFRRTEQVEQQAREMQRRLAGAVEAREQFLSMASHELRTPLAALSLQIQWLAMNARGEVREPLSAAAVRKQLELAEAQVGRLAGLISALFDVSRVASVESELDLAEADLCRLVRDVGARFVGACKDDGCALELDAHGAIVAVCDAARVDQMIANLMANALKYGAGRPIRLAVRAEDGTAVVTVADRGVGVAPEHHARIFERFDRASSSIAYGGLGLGLYITRRLALAHGGSIDVKSAVGDGATFELRLPLSGPALPSRRQPQNS